MRLRNLANLAVGLVVGAVIGYFAGARSGAPEMHSSTAVSSGGMDMAAVAPAATPIPTIPKRAGVEDLRRSLASASHADFAESILAIQGLSIEECKAAKRLLANAPGEQRGYLEQALARRWAELDPSALSIRRCGSRTAIFETIWAKRRERR